MKSSTLEPTAKALSALGDLFAKDAKLAVVLSTPTLTDGDKSAIVAELQKSIGAAGANDTVKNFLTALAENNRLGLLKDVSDKFSQLMSASRGEVEMIVTSAQASTSSFSITSLSLWCMLRNSNRLVQQLDNRTLSRLEAAVSKSQYVGPGKKLKVTNEVKPDILGGLVVEIGDRTIDLSVSSKLAKMNKLLTDTL